MAAWLKSGLYVVEDAVSWKRQGLMQREASLGADEGC